MKKFHQKDKILFYFVNFLFFEKKVNTKNIFCIKNVKNKYLIPIIFLMNEPDFIEIPYKRPNSKKIKQIGTMTQYEYTRLLECRAKQIAAGMPYFIEWTDVFDPIAIAKQEIIERKTNLIIVRKMPDLTQPSGFRDEIWDPKDMNIYDS